MKLNEKFQVMFSLSLILLCGLFSNWFFIQIVAGLNLVLLWAIILVGISLLFLTSYIFLLNKSKLKNWLFILCIFSIISGFLLAKRSLKSLNNVKGKRIYFESK